MWSHPDLLPTAEALDNPESFFDGEQEDIEAELDSFLEGLFGDSEQGSAPHEAAFGDDGASQNSADGDSSGQDSADDDSAPEDPRHD